MVKKNKINILLIALIALSIFMMIMEKGMLLHTMAGPNAPRIPHYYNYINPHVCFDAGMYPAPISAILAGISAIFSTVTLLQKNKGKATFIMILTTFLMILIVVINSEFTMINLMIALLMFVSLVISYFIFYKL